MAKRIKIIEDIGFGNKGSGQTQKLINEDGSYNVVRKGHMTFNLYATLLEMGWIRFYTLILSFYIFFNLVFAFIFNSLGPGAINGVNETDFLKRYLHCFFFSIQTFTTVGYGNMSPQSITANILSSLVAFIGLMVLAVITGMFFARLSKPIAHILFSSNVVISPYKEGKALMFRMVNSRNTVIADLKITVILTWLRVQNSIEKREYIRLDLERDEVTLFPLNWTIVHPIEESSPLFGLTPKDLEDRNAEIIIDVKGHNETFNQMVKSRKSYKLNHALCDRKFSSMYYTNENGMVILELDKIDKIEVI